MSEIIRMGDPTSHGGRVIEGSARDICHGKPIAFIGHKTFCPLCKGSFPIIEGAMSTTFYGRGVALAGMKTACGAVLIATQHTDFVTPRSGNGASKVADAKTANAAKVSASSTEEFDLFFLVSDATGMTLVDWPYCIEMKNGEKIEGRTNGKGETARVTAKQAEEATLNVYEPDVTPIDVNWDF